MEKLPQDGGVKRLHMISVSFFSHHLCMDLRLGMDSVHQ